MFQASLKSKPESLISRKTTTITLAALFATLLLRSHSPVSEFKLTHWMFNYEYEFVKRGLIGEITRELNIAITQTNIFIIHLGLITITFLSMAFIFSRPSNKHPRSIASIIFFFAAITSPATFQHFNYDSGRFDIIGLNLTIICLWIISKYSTLIISASIITLMSIAILAHEASFIMFSPIIISYWLYRDPGTLKTATKAAVFFTLLIIAYTVSTNGQVERIPLKEHISELRTTYGDLVNSDAVTVLHKGSLSENISLTIQKSLTIDNAIQHLAIFLIVIAPICIIIHGFTKKADEKLPKTLLFFLASSLSPLALYPLGYDHPRWWALAITNLLIATSIAAYHHNKFKFRLERAIIENRNIVAIMIITAMICGPMGVIGSFPLSAF